MEIKLTKLEVARRQLETSIILFFSDGDEVSIHALSSSANDILKDLGKFYNKKTIHNDIFNIIKKEKRNEIFKIINKPKNYFKHANIKPDEELTFNPSSNEYFIFIAIQSYSEINGKVTPAMMAFRVYFYLKNPKLVDFKEMEQFWDELSKNVNLNEKKTFIILINEFQKKLKQKNNQHNLINRKNIQS